MKCLLFAINATYYQLLLNIRMKTQVSAFTFAMIAMKIGSRIKSYAQVTETGVVIMDISLDLGLEEKHVAKTSDDYYTPSWIFETLGLEFDTDPAQPIGGCSWIPVKKYFTIIDDGLKQEWTGRVWLNPPYSKPSEWVKRFVAHGNGVMLINVAKSRWFDDLWVQAEGIAMLPYNMKFETPSDGQKGIFMPTALFAMGDENVAALSKFGRIR